MTTPNLSTSAVNSPLIGQPMVSYETQWLGTPTTASSSIEDRLRRRSSQGGNNPEDARGRSQSSAKKPSTKAERRALQEKQRAEKQKRVSTANTSTNPPNNADKKPPVNNPTRPKNAALAAKNDQQRKSILNHLELPKKPDTDKNKDLHPMVLSLALLFSQYKITGSNARCIAVLETFSQVIKDHQPPEDATFVRHIQKHLDPHIAFLLKYRYMSLSIRECIRWLKKVMADLVAIHPPVADEDARQMLQNQIARFIRERITMADELIAHNALTKIENGDVVLTFAKSSVVERIFLEAKKAGRDFQVIVVDSRPLLEGAYRALRLMCLLTVTNRKESVRQAREKWNQVQIYIDIWYLRCIEGSNQSVPGIACYSQQWLILCSHRISRSCNGSYRQTNPCHTLLRDLQVCQPYTSRLVSDE